MNIPEPISALFDAAGFMLDPTAWNEDIARHMAKRDGIGPLTEAHWKIIHHLRHHWLDCHSIPAITHTCHLVGMGPQCLEELFHGAREAWRIAGLPDPGEEAKAYM